MFASGMTAQNRILLLDDDEQMLELYQTLLEQLPSRPEVQVCNTGARAIAMLESEPFTLLISDLRMPKMDGLQVLAIVRRKFPRLRLVVLTGVLDEEYRSRAYAQGVEMFWQKPGTVEDIQLFQDCIESMLDRPNQAQEGFRGVQSKNSYQALLLDSARALDESKGPPAGAGPEAGSQTPGGAPAGLAALGRFEGVGFVLAIPPDEKQPADSWSLENATDTASWARDAHRRLAQLGGSLRAGEFAGAFGFGLQEHWAFQAHEQKGLLCAGFRPALSAEQVEQTMKHVFDKWAS
jgi:CheY-like chemotaxis protein